MKQYFGDQVRVSWSGLDFSEGLVQGSFLVFRRAAPNYKFLSNGMGGGIRMRTRNRSGEMDLSVESSSFLHQKLCALATTDYLLGVITGPMRILDESTRESWTLQGASITTEPDEQRANVSMPVTWTWSFVDINHVPNLLQRNQVGS